MPVIEYYKKFPDESLNFFLKTDKIYFFFFINVKIINVTITPISPRDICNKSFLESKGRFVITANYTCVQESLVIDERGK